MSDTVNDLGQPIGFPLQDWQGCEHPRNAQIQGNLCRLEPIDVDRHASDLFAAFSQDQDRHNWTYLPYGPFETEEALRSWMFSTCLGDDPCFSSVIDLQTGRAVGVASYLRIKPALGVIEVGHIHFSPLMQAKPISTEAMFLMMGQVFDVWGYRRYEWKCDALNQPSCTAAQRLGFLFEGIFRQATMYKLRNRDTAWYSILDREWPTVKAVFENWLRAENFGPDGAQKTSLSRLMTQSLER
ncbi:MAG: GNAT family N-acetyltransferase [Gammaproteobacteria bacterium]|nr:GNAT family N-acetyltransferase [Gammaproteobacteria bacterium]